jgi:hypothetical protein
MRVYDFISDRLNSSVDVLRVFIAQGPEDRRLCLDGQILSLCEQMPENREGALFRIGRHLYVIRNDKLFCLTQEEALDIRRALKWTSVPKG